MAKHLPLKFRIAGVVFILEAIMVAFVLGISTHTQLSANRAEFATKEDVLVNVIVNLSRTALLIHDYNALQSQIEQLIADPHIVDIIVADRADIIVAASNITYVGKKMPSLENDEIWFWRTVDIVNDTGLTGTVAVQFSHLGLLISEREAVDRGWRTAAIGMAIITAISIMAGTFLTRRLGALSNAASRIAAGDLHARAQIKGEDEIAIVGKAFDQMAESVSRSFNELHVSRNELLRAQNELEQRVAIRTTELAVARDYALNANRAKGAFLANISHELRTPLNAIIGYSEMLLEDADAQNAPSAPDLHKVLSSAKHLLSLVNNVLDLAKIDAGKMDLHVEKFDIHDVLREAAETVQPMMTKNNNRFRWHCPKSIGGMTSDRTKVYQSLLNLLSNAAKYTENGHVVCLVTRVTDDDKKWVEFVVQDTGIGIAEKKMSYLFEEFSQTDSSVRHLSGTGLGLVLTRRMSRILGGDVTVGSQEQLGSTFILRLPEFPPAINDSGKQAFFAKSSERIDHDN